MNEYSFRYFDLVVEGLKVQVEKKMEGMFGNKAHYGFELWVKMLCVCAGELLRIGFSHWREGMSIKSG